MTDPYDSCPHVDNGWEYAWFSEEEYSEYGYLAVASGDMWEIIDEETYYTYYYTYDDEDWYYDDDEDWYYDDDEERMTYVDE